jgi:tetratricopeptide (TPR) repeat protein
VDLDLVGAEMIKFKNLGRFMFCIALGAAVVTPVSAKSELASLSDEKLLSRYSSTLKDEQANHCNAVPFLLDEMEKRPKLNRRVAGARLYSNYICAWTEGRHKDAYQLSSQLEAATGISLGEDIKLILATSAENYPAAASHVIKMAVAPDGGAFGRMEIGYFWELSRQLVRNKHDEARTKMFRAVADSPHWDKLTPEARSGIAQVTITLDAKAGLYDRAKTLSGDLQGPYPFFELLAHRTMEPIWPLLEDIAGPNMQRIAAADVAIKAEIYSRDKSNRKAFQHYAHALHFAGKFEEAIALVQTLDHSPKALLNATEDDLWAMNIEAYALDSLGHKTEAEAVFDKMAALPYDAGSRDWLVNFVINRASRLVGLGKWDKGLEATMLAYEITEKSGSPYAKMLVRKARICALVNLGRSKEAAPLLIEAYDRREDTFVTAAEAHLCAGQDDKAAAIVLEALKDTNHVYSMVEELQGEDFEIFYVRELLPSLRDRVKQRPEVAAAFNAVARDLPERLIPAASLRRRDIAKAN